jgi:hypothetical protein
MGTGCAEGKFPEGSRVAEPNRVFGGELTSDEGTVEADATAMSTVDVDETGGGGGAVPVIEAEISSFRLEHEASALHKKMAASSGNARSTFVARLVL